MSCGCEILNCIKNLICPTYCGKGAVRLVETSFSVVSYLEIFKIFKKVPFRLAIIIAI